MNKALQLKTKCYHCGKIIDRKNAIAVNPETIISGEEYEKMCERINKRKQMSDKVERGYTCKCIFCKNPFDSENPHDNACDKCLCSATTENANQKYEKIEKMAWELMLAAAHYDKKANEYRCAPVNAAWEVAEDFYNMIKEKGKEMNE